MIRLIFIIISFSLALALGKEFIWPKYKRLAEFKKQIEVAKENIEKKELYFQDLEKKISELKEKYPTQLAKIESALPSEPDLPLLLNFLHTLSSAHNLSLSNLTFSVAPAKLPETDPQQKVVMDLMEIAISFSLSGNYDSFKNFLSELESNIKLIGVRSISLNSDKKGVLNINLQTTTYSY